MFVGGIVLYRISPDWDGFFSFVGSILDLIAIGLFMGGLGWIVYNIVAWRTAEFAVTNMRVLREEGLARKRSSTTLLSSLSDVKSSVSFVGGKLGYGDITLLTQSGSAGEDRFLCITTPIEFRNAVMNQKMVDRKRGPAAAPAPPAGCLAGRGGAGRAPAAPAGARDDLAPSAAAAIASLADLRDRGAITEVSSRPRRRSCSPGCDRPDPSWRPAGRARVSASCPSRVVSRLPRTRGAHTWQAAGRGPR